MKKVSLIYDIIYVCIIRDLAMQRSRGRGEREELALEKKFKKFFQIYLIFLEFFFRLFLVKEIAFLKKVSLKKFMATPLYMMTQKNHKT